ncbi:unannotated protein [freshwater metagenome]|uniref:Unannotated protein n=1 Tax=freshwater metagenome TaxID=449393 RepID=A0A6J6KG90_9ZZZZ
MLRRPRCGIPIQTSSSPRSAAAEIIASVKGITDSPPSSEKRFCPTNFVCRNDSNASALLSLRKIRSCSSRSGLVKPTSTCSWIHLRSTGSEMYIYSIPTERQYESRKIPRMLRNFINFFPPNPPVANSRSRSHKVRPCVTTSRSGCERWRYSSGSISAIKWPYVR